MGPAQTPTSTSAPTTAPAPAPALAGKSHNQIVYEQWQIFEDINKKRQGNKAEGKCQPGEAERIMSPFPPGHHLWRWNGSAQDQNEIKPSKKKIKVQATTLIPC